MAPGDTARIYHELTSWGPWTGEWPPPADDPRILQDFEPNDLAAFPAPCKSYPPGLPVVGLPRSWAPGTSSATAVLAGKGAAPPATPDLARLARILHLSAGVVRTAVRRDGRRYLFRAAGSAGGQFPLELYVAARGVDGLRDGVHWFDPASHALVEVGPAPEGEATTLVVTGVPWRTGWRYSERGFRHVHWDAGTMLAQTLAVAEDAGLAPRLRTVFPDDTVARLVGADGVHEFPVAIVTFGDGRPAIGPRGRAASGDVDRRPPVEFPFVTQVKRAGDGAVLGEAWPAGPPLDGEPPASRGLDDVILDRSSTRKMDGSRSIDVERLRWSLAASLRGSPVRQFVVCHAVDGVEPGLYRWPSLDEPLRRGSLRDELYRVCLDQELGRDAAAVVVGAADLDRVDDRGYREAQLAAGIVDGRLHLAAYALGFGASGMTFADTEIASLLGEPLAALLFTCLGVPVRRAGRGQAPGVALAEAATAA